jgi:hypothetical protein
MKIDSKQEGFSLALAIEEKFRLPARQPVVTPSLLAPSNCSAVSAKKKLSRALLVELSSMLL